MGEQENEPNSGVEQLRKLAVKRRYDELESAWTEAVESGSVEPAELIAVLEKTARGADADYVDSLLWFLLSERAQQHGADDALAVATAAVPLLPQSRALRQEAAGLYKTARASVAGIDALVEATIRREDLPLPEAVERLEKLLTLTPETCVLDTGRDRLGKVAGFNADEGKFEVAFEDGTQTYPPEAAANLEVLAGDDFRSLFVFDPEQLRGLAEGDPDALVTSTLRAFGPRMTFKTLKSRLSGIVPPRAWAKWWAKAKPQLRESAWIEMSDKAQPTFALRKQPIPFEARVKARFNGADTAGGKLDVAVKYLTKATNPDPGVLEFVGRGVAALEPALRDAEPEAELGALAVRARIHELAPDAAAPPDPDRVRALLDCDAPAELVQSVRNDDLIGWILALVREAAGERWPGQLAVLLPGCTEAGCNLIADTLTGAGQADLLRSAVAGVLARPERHARALCWAWRAASDGRFPEALGDADLPGLAVQLFSTAQTLARATRRKRYDSDALLRLLRGAVSAKDYAPLRRALEKADVHRAQQIRTYIERHTGLTVNVCSRVHEILRRTHPELFAETIEPWEEDAVYTTEAGLEKRQRELQELVTGKMAEAARAVGEAAADGDLSENFAWTAALAERDRLAGTATRMQEEIRKAKLITPDLARSKTITVGSAAEVKDLTNDDVVTMTFLGPWDADPDRNIHAYSAALGLAFMGKAVGDDVRAEFDGHEHAWEILDVQSSF